MSRIDIENRARLNRLEDRTTDLEDGTTAIPYAPGSLPDWPAGDPGDQPDGLDVLADRATTLEAGARSLDITLGAEAADVRRITIQVNDGNGNAVTAAHKLIVEKYATQLLWTPEADIAYTLAAAGAGTVDEQLVGATQYACTTDAAGLLELDATDVVGGSNVTRFLRARLLSDGTDGISTVEARLAVIWDAV